MEWRPSWHDVKSASPAADPSPSEKTDAGKRAILPALHFAAKLRKVMRHIDTGSYTQPAQYAAAEWMQPYFAEYTLKWNPFALHFYEAVIRNHITPALGKMKLQALNTVQIQTLVNSFCRPVMQRRQSTLAQNCTERLWCSASRSESAGNRLGTPFAVPTSTASTVPHTRRRQLLYETP